MLPLPQALGEPLYRVSTGNYEYRLILRCRQEARARFSQMRKDVLEKMELLDQKHGEGCGLWAGARPTGHTLLGQPLHHPLPISQLGKLWPREVQYLPELPGPAHGRALSQTQDGSFPEPGLGGTGRAPWAPWGVVHHPPTLAGLLHCLTGSWEAAWVLCRAGQPWPCSLPGHEGSVRCMMGCPGG